MFDPYFTIYCEDLRTPLLAVMPSQSSASIRYSQIIHSFTPTLIHFLKHRQLPSSPELPIFGILRKRNVICFRIGSGCHSNPIPTINVSESVTSSTKVCVAIISLCSPVLGYWSCVHARLGRNTRESFSPIVIHICSHLDSSFTDCHPRFYWNFEF